jgi:hypothetical protein
VVGLGREELKLRVIGMELFFKGGKAGLGGGYLERWIRRLVTVGWWRGSLV